MMAMACAVLVRKNPGMSRVLIASISSLMPAALRRGAAYCRLLMKVARAAAGSRVPVQRPARQLSCVQPSAVDVEGALDDADGALDAGLEFFNAFAVTADTAFAASPVARRHIVQRQRQLVLIQLLAQQVLVIFIGE